MKNLNIKKRCALQYSIFNIQSSLSLQMIAAQPPKKANWSRKTIAIQDSFLPLSL